MVIIHKVYIQLCFCAIVCTANRNGIYSFICKIAITLILWLYLSLCPSPSYNLLRSFWSWPLSVNPYLKPTLHHHFFLEWAWQHHFQLWNWQNPEYIDMNQPWVFSRHRTQPKKNLIRPMVFPPYDKWHQEHKEKQLPPLGGKRINKLRVLY